ncbi:cytochrome c family protein [Caulobacter sp. UNC279MFTsu5.1]|uniref:c-type cytochrome n=1 Tax=Caulobacter sp. UNC279MFTsu5.1 TaxID=1502775 RepID=UPI0008E9455C|nr:c-type cytochrome [Caulobacter sp. UNC279MFTsu5.1]SFJ22666.1 cytochrome c [Caulobacter sp. UNC279MFTsu5.1]
MKYPLILAAAFVATATSAAAAPPSGQQVFEQRCSVCHSLQPAPGKMGPPLAGVVGRKAGTAPGYAYSNALKASNITWTPEQLDAFVKAPGKTVPGTKMLLGAPDAEQRAAVIQYLGSLKK